MKRLFCHSHLTPGNPGCPPVWHGQGVTSFRFVPISLAIDFVSSVSGAAATYAPEMAAFTLPSERPALRMIQRARIRLDELRSQQFRWTLAEHPTGLARVHQIQAPRAVYQDDSDRALRAARNEVPRSMILLARPGALAVSSSVSQSRFSISEQERVRYAHELTQLNQDTFTRAGRFPQSRDAIAPQADPASRGSVPGRQLCRPVPARPPRRRHRSRRPLGRRL